MKTIVGEEEKANPSRLRRMRARQHSSPERQRHELADVAVADHSLSSISHLIRAILVLYPSEFEGRFDFSKSR